MKAVTLIKTAFGLLAIIVVVSMMNCSPAQFSQNPKPAPTTFEPLGCPGYVPDPQGCLKARCQGGISNPSVYLTWCTMADANSNSLEKGDSFPSDPERFWDWVQPNADHSGSSFPFSQHDYTDHAVSAGNTYWYQAKFKPAVPSNTSQITIPLDSCTCGP
jgi:hypothetical protein